MGTWRTVSLERPENLGVKKCGEHEGSWRPSVSGGRSLDGNGSFVSQISPACPSPLGLSQEISCGCRLGLAQHVTANHTLPPCPFSPTGPTQMWAAVGGEGRCRGIGGLAFGVKEGGCRFLFFLLVFGPQYISRPLARILSQHA